MKPVSHTFRVDDVWIASQSKTLRVNLTFQASAPPVHCLSKTHGPGWMYFCDLWHLYICTKWDVLSSNIGPSLTRRPTQPLVCTHAQKIPFLTNGCAFLIQTLKDMNTVSMFIQCKHIVHLYFNKIRLDICIIQQKQNLYYSYYTFISPLRQSLSMHPGLS